MAEYNSGETLFNRRESGDQEDNEDIWDDTALIKAYDEAVSLVKNKVAEQNGTSILEPATAGKHKRPKKKSKNKSKRRKWRVGDQCRAKFSEDNVIYEAEILSVDDETGTCYVRYTDYGNEEEHDIKDLLLAHGSSQKKKPKQEDPETDSDWKGAQNFTIPPRPSSRGSRGSRSAAEPLPHMAHPQTHPHWPGYPTTDPMMHQFPPMPNFHGHFPSQVPPFHSSRIPTMPPPPPPMLDMSDGDNEALCSMLMAWYMSGYHTGYYQGLQEGRKQSSVSSPYVNR